MARKNPQPRRKGQKSAGGNRGKTRPDVPSTPMNKAMSGKQVRRGRR